MANDQDAAAAADDYVVKFKTVIVPRALITPTAAKEWLQARSTHGHAVGTGYTSSWDCAICGRIKTY